MNISKQTIAILKNFQQINNSIIVDEKFILKTGMGATFENAKTAIVAVADIPEEFPEFCVYDLNKLLASISMFDLDDLDFTFDELYITLKQAHRTVKIPMASIASIPYKVKQSAVSIKNPKVEYKSTFDMSGTTLKNIKKAASTFKALQNHFKIEIKKGKGILKLTNLGNSGSDLYIETFEVDKNINASIIIDLNDLKVIDGDYEISICDNVVLKLHNTDLKLTYQITAMNVREGK